MRDTNIKIEPFELLDLISYVGLKKENIHGYVCFSGHISADLEDTYAEMALQETWAVATAVEDSGETKILFNGVVTNLKIETKNDVRLLTVTLRSGTYLMDTMPHIRSYQAPSLTYHTVLKSFTDQYEDGSFIMTKGNGETIPPLVMQYDETDWEFAKRLASHFQTIVMPDCKTKGEKYFFGLPQFSEGGSIETVHYSVEKRVDEYIYKTKNKVDGLRESDSVYYIVKLRDIYELGAPFSLNGRSLFISEIRTKLEGGELYHYYYLKSENGFKVPKTYNQKVIGASLDSRIIDVTKDVVEVSIDKDENQSGAGVNWYKYSTPYSTDDGTGWYCMPEPGDAVCIHIPSADEAGAYVISSTHLEPSVGDERVNPDNKSIMNKYHKEILFTPNSLTLTNNNDLSIELLDEEGIKIHSGKAIQIKSDLGIDISSVTAAIQIVAPDSITLIQGDTAINLSDTLRFSGAHCEVE